MALAVHGIALIVLQHREDVSSLLGKPRGEAIWRLIGNALQAISAASFLLYYVELVARRRNLLLRQHWNDLGIYLVKGFFICLSVYMLLLRCQLECNPIFYMKSEKHFFRAQWYLRLFAAAAASASIAVAAFLGTWGLLFTVDPQTRQPIHPAKLLGTLPNSIVEACGLEKWLESLSYRTAAALVMCINCVVCPGVLVFVLWEYWLPKLPMLHSLHQLLANALPKLS